MELSDKKIGNFCLGANGLLLAVARCSEWSKISIGYSKLVEGYALLVFSIRRAAPPKFACLPYHSHSPRYTRPLTRPPTHLTTPHLTPTLPFHPPARAILSKPGPRQPAAAGVTLLGAAAQSSCPSLHSRISYFAPIPTNPAKSLPCGTVELQTTFPCGCAPTQIPAAQPAAEDSEDRPPPA